MQEGMTFAISQNNFIKFSLSPQEYYIYRLLTTTLHTVLLCHGKSSFAFKLIQVTFELILAHTKDYHPGIHRSAGRHQKELCGYNTNQNFLGRDKNSLGVRKKNCKGKVSKNCRNAISIFICYFNLTTYSESLKNQYRPNLRYR